MSDIRVLVVDDSVVIRKIVSEMLNAEPGIVVAGTASNGKIALARIGQLNPDLVILDVEMPVMTGLEALQTIRELYPDLPVVMFSASTERGAESTFDALSLGASDYVAKPANVQHADAAMAHVRKDLISKVRALCRRSADVSVSKTIVERPISAGKLSFPRRIDLIAIGISTGGPNALAEMLPHLPAALPVPVVIVQHMPPLFTGYLAKRLDADCKLQVREGKTGDVLEPGTCWIAPGGLHMCVERHEDQLILSTNEAPPENHCRPAVDVLFRSVADAVGSRTLAVVMTGMGQDGSLGCESISECGGQVIVQDESSSVVWGMPGFVSRAGLADEVLPLNQIASSITQRTSFGRRASGGLLNHGN